MASATLTLISSQRRVSRPERACGHTTSGSTKRPSGWAWPLFRCSGRRQFRRRESSWTDVAQLASSAGPERAKTYYWVDPREQVVVLFMTQSTLGFDLPDFDLRALA